MTTLSALRFLPLGSSQLRPFTLSRLLGLSLVGCALVMTSLPAMAQAPAPEAAGGAGIEQKTERIIHHDRGSRIEEVRVGGQTRSIQVDTNSQIPGYQVQPIDPAQSTQDKGAAGKSSWRIIKF
jgi:hypothetical protein